MSFRQVETVLVPGEDEDSSVLARFAYASYVLPAQMALCGDLS